MGDPGFEVIEVAPGLDAGTLVDRLRSVTARSVLLHDRRFILGAGATDRLAGACLAPMVATASPVPMATASPLDVVEVDLDPRLPPAPSLPLGLLEACCVSVDALRSVPLPEPHPGDAAITWFVRMCDALTRAGWRHVATPGTVLGWNPTADGSDCWTPTSLEAMVGPANQGLATHRLWSRTRLGGVRIIVDGACVTDTIHNGSQSVVINIVRALTRVRPDADVALAVQSDYMDVAAGLVAEDGVRVVERAALDEQFDVVYRPYQLLDPGEVSWLIDVADRWVVGQLDTISFSNPSYHPPAHFHAVRNLQRWSMRHADAVAFISEFGLETAFAECPDLDRSRLFVVSCGADPVPPAAPEADADIRRRLGSHRFLACVSATFSHKNRQHAIVTFGEFCRRTGYEGLLVLVGPEPYYGRSTADEERVLTQLDPRVRERVVRLGQVDEPTKWWLLGTADLVLYPSVVEGFGLVPFEAAAVGTPSLSRASSAIVEVLGAGPATMDTWDAVAWADAIARIIDAPAAAADVLDTVAAAADRHTWERTADLTWEAIDAALVRPRASLVAEEGGLSSRIAPDPARLAAGARTMHFAQRVVNYARRRAVSWGTGRPGSG